MKIEQLPLQPTAYVPNSPLPVLVYRDVLPSPRDEGSVTQFLTRHNTWEKGVSQPTYYHLPATNASCRALGATIPDVTFTQIHTNAMASSKATHAFD